MAGFQADAVDNFLLNVEPGFYAAVGAMIGRHYVYFPEKVIKASVAEVKPNRMVYMGEFKLQKISYKINNISPDKLQHHYYSNLLIGDHKDHARGNVALPWGRNLSFFHVPEVNKIIHSNDAEIDFLKGYKGLFNKSGWIGSIQNRINDLKP